VGSHLDRIIQEKNLLRPRNIQVPPPELKWVREPKEKVKEQVKSSNKNRIKYLSKFYMILRSVFKFFLDLRIQHNRIKYIASLLDHVSAIILPEASPAYDTPIYAKAASMVAVPLLTTPFSRDTPNSYAAIYKTNKDLNERSLLRRINDFLFPHWTIHYQDIKISRIEPRTVLIHELLRMASRKPWNTIGSFENFVAVQNKIDYEFYSQNGVSKEKLYIVGAPEQDSLYQAQLNNISLKKQVCQELNLDPEKKIVTTPLVQTHWVSGREEAEYQDYRTMIDAWMAPLKSQNSQNVIISLHPSQKYSDFSYLESEHVKISQREITELIAITDLMIACVSSVIPLAIAAGKPVINYDVYRYSLENNFLAFPEALGTITVTNYNEYVESLQRCIKDESFYNELQNLQKSISSDWGMLDGKSCKRLSDLIEAKRK
jgi:hypothetical protein